MIKKRLKKVFIKQRKMSFGRANRMLFFEYKIFNHARKIQSEN
jgi:hypothetical protein